MSLYRSRTNTVPRICEQCGQPFFAQPGNVRRGKGKFCSRQCTVQHRSEAASSPDYFWERVKKTDDCWEWTGAIGKGGYGNLAFRGRYMRAHRVAWILTNGDIPKGMFLCHRCDNPRCVRPDHLFPGSPADNVHDAIKKGRNATGERQPTAILTTAQVQAVRRRYKQGDISQRALGEEYGVAQSTISAIVTRTNWKHV